MSQAQSICYSQHWPSSRSPEWGFADRNRLSQDGTFRPLMPMTHSQKSTLKLDPKVGVKIDADLCAVCHADSDPKLARKLDAENQHRLEHCSILSR